MPADRPPEWCNINATYLRQVEDDAKTHSLPVFIDIRKALHVSLDDLLRDELGENEISKIHEIEMLWREAETGWLHFLWYCLQEGDTLEKQERSVLT